MTAAFLPEKLLILSACLDNPPTGLEQVPPTDAELTLLIEHFEELHLTNKDDYLSCSRSLVSILKTVKYNPELTSPVIQWLTQIYLGTR